MFLLAATLIAAVVGTSLLFPNALLDRLWSLNKPAAAFFRALPRLAGVLLIALAAASAFAGFALLRRHRWAWWFAVALFSVDCAGDVVSVFITSDVLRSASGAVISLAFLYALTRPYIRSWFKAEPRS